jgi:hypothetical protein
MMYSTYGLFLTCTQKISFVFTRHASWFLHNIQAISSGIPVHQQSNPALLTWEGQLLARGDKFPSALDPRLVTTAPPLGFYRFHPFLTLQFTLHYLHTRHQRSWSSPSGTSILSIFMFPFQYIYIYIYVCVWKTGTSGKQKWQTSVCFLQMENGSLFSLVGKW